MPKEQGHFGAARSSSKNAKDKSNSATLRASQGGVHREQAGRPLTNHMMRCRSEKDSEKDSGYSEAGSDSVHTDVDERSSVSDTRRQSSSNSAHSLNSAHSQNSTHSMGPYKKLTSVYVIKNMMVKPSRAEPHLHNPLAWGGAWHSLSGTKGPAQVLLIQQPALPAPGPSPSAIAPPTNHLKKLSGRSSSYLPILNSYPRIAPHPRKEGHESKASARAAGGKESGEGQSQSKRVCTEEEKREAVSTTTHLLKPHQQQRDHPRAQSYSQHKSRSGPAHRSAPGHASSTSKPKGHASHHSDNISSPSVSSSQTPSPPSSSSSDSSPPSSSSSSPPSSSPSSSSPYRPAPDSTSTRQRRFHNTAEILNQSGLLAITLRTKELLKQNAATEREIAQLRQHTDFLCQAAQACQAGSTENVQHLQKLLQTMSESGSYPTLDLNPLQALTNQTNINKDEKEERKSHQASANANANPSVVSLCNIDDGTSPPSPLFAPSPGAEDSEQAVPVLEHLDSCRSLTDTELSLTVLPESSTRNDYIL